MFAAWSAPPFWSADPGRVLSAVTFANAVQAATWRTDGFARTFMQHHWPIDHHIYAYPVSTVKLKPP